MADLKNLRSKPLFQMSEQELEDLLKERRLSRRTPKKKITESKAKSSPKKNIKVSAGKLIDSMSADQIANLLTKLKKS